jgi:hypothetical protein
MTDELIHFGETFDSENWSGKDLTGHKFFMCSMHHVIIDAKTDLYGTTFMGCQATYLEAEGACLDHFSAQGTDFRHSNFKDSTWQRSRLHQCDLTWAHFGGANLKDCVADGSDFKLSHIHKAKAVNFWDRDMVSELIRVKAEGDVEVLMVAALVKNSLDFCWREWQTVSKMPQWERVSKVIYRVLNGYPGIDLKINPELLGG